ncbi:hypothetical protein ABT324_05040 [Saccharopolyspora sp. NPDC000359]|uniref:hypothetical protein n=1 Tax=Saccharopolyspora sp. NPDC000359 TaxID=3154251 RepID=UPI00331CD4E0
MTSDVLLRRATGADALDMAEVWLRSSSSALPMVRRAHSDEVRSWFAHVVVSDHECWVAEEQGGAGAAPPRPAAARPGTG